MKIREEQYTEAEHLVAELSSDFANMLRVVTKVPISVLSILYDYVFCITKQLPDITIL